MEKWIDLHVHTFHSDGTLSPSELVRHACEKGLAAIAITDHDFVTGIDEAVEAGKEIGIEVIPGVEYSTKFENKSIHILGLNIDHRNKDIIEIAIAARNDYNEKRKQVISKFEEIGFDGLSWEELQSMNKIKPTLLHLCEYLVIKGIAGGLLEVKEKYLGKGKAAHVKSSKRELSVPEAVSLIHNAGGIAIWAHPVLCEFEPSELEETAAAFKKMKVDGIEAYQSKHSKTDIQDIIGLAKKYDLLISGGSDYHGNLDTDCELGIVCDAQRIPYSILDKMKSIYIK